MEHLLHGYSNMLRLIITVMLCIMMYHNCLSGMKLRGNYLLKKNKEQPDIYIQNYSLTSSFFPTPQISLLGSVRYNEIHQSTHITQNITPTGTLGISNDIFNLNISGTLSETHDTQRNDISSSSYNLNFSSFYKKIINLNLNYTHSSTKDDGNPKNIDIESNNYGITLKRSFFRHFSFYYDFKKNIYENKIEQGKVITYNDTIIGSLGGIKFDFFKIKANFSSNFSYKRNRMKSKITKYGYAKFPIPAEIVWDPEIEKNSKLTSDQKIIIKVPATGIDVIYFYTDSTYMSLIPETVKWDVYWSETGDEDSWELIQSSVSFPYKFNKTFSKEGYLKFEISYLPEDNIVLNSPFVECYIIKSSNKGYATLISHSRAFSSNIGLHHDFTQNIYSNYNFNFSLTNNSKGKETKNIYHSLSSFFNINKYFNSSISVSQNYKIVQDSPNSSTVSLTFSNNSQLIDTLSTSLAYSKSINYESNKKINSTDSITFVINALIYPELTTKWTNSFSYSKSYSSNVITRNYNSNLSITARFTDALTMTTSYSYTKSISSTSSSTHKITTNFSWRVSEKMFINYSESINIQSRTTPQYSQNFTIWMELTKKIQYNFSYSGNRGIIKNDSFSQFLSWKIGKNISAKVNYSNQISKGERRWSATIGLSFSF